MTERSLQDTEQARRSKNSAPRTTSHRSEYDKFWTLVARLRELQDDVPDPIAVVVPHARHRRDFSTNFPLSPKTVKCIGFGIEHLDRATAPSELQVPCITHIVPLSSSSKVDGLIDLAASAVIKLVSTRSAGKNRRQREKRAGRPF